MCNRKLAYSGRGSFIQTREDTGRTLVGCIVPLYKETSF